MINSPQGETLQVSPTFAEKWWIYQRERFPVFAHGPLVLAFSSSAVCFSTQLRGHFVLPPWYVFAFAFLSSFISFLHLRLADEFKDFEEDSLYRPYRPVPRGLVTLRELAILGFITAAIQLAMAVCLDTRLLWPLMITWTYLALMSKEFFCVKWLKAHPFTYMWTHMLIMPLIDFYATACDWLPTNSTAPQGIFWFVAVSFFSGFIIEIGRKIRSPLDEETGVPTYSALWGRTSAVTGWLIVIVLTAVSAVIAAHWINFYIPMYGVLATFIVIAILLAVNFLRNPIPGSGKRFELFSGLWTLALYLTLGIIPLVYYATRSAG
ncbi:MAG: UbiA family prenyltransferase [Candidatus Methylacidiphilales bacterium]|nr:UbiA family prenyltransferase [Candidatus Methylacidiphilales bacterium]